MKRKIITGLLLIFLSTLYAQEAIVINQSKSSGICHFLHDIHHIKKQEASWVISMYSGEEYSYPLTTTTFIHQIMQQQEYDAIDNPENLLDVYYDAVEETIVFDEDIKGHVIIFTISGQLMLQQQGFSGKRLYVGELPMGVYLLSAENKYVKFLKM